MPQLIGIQFFLFKHNLIQSTINVLHLTQQKLLSPLASFCLKKNYVHSSRLIRTISNTHTHKYICVYLHLSIIYYICALHICTLHYIYVHYTLPSVPISPTQVLITAAQADDNFLLK